ncbi:Protein-lysine N-methyltransferase efm5 [Malassezia cuniculi]|uniref:Protein-lysine N-methyltransferase efm5 n=1 Tax=Malassezia cuniculi TaxID=948313 RepID=A0AAF0ENU7_9BASI|nr:Protein-lysine N-methyltransferase efm5 [Malassezia cuniculi]
MGPKRSVPIDEPVYPTPSAIRSTQNAYAHLEKARMGGSRAAIMSTRHSLLANTIATRGFRYLHEVKGHRSCVNALAFSRNGGQWMASGGDDLRILVRDMFDFDEGRPGPEASTYRVTHRLFGHFSNIFSLSWSSGNTHLFSGAGDSQVLVYDVNMSDMPVSRRPLRGNPNLTIDDHTGSICSVSAHPTSANLVLSASEYGELFVSDLRMSGVAHSALMPNQISSASWNPNASDGLTFAVATVAQAESGLALFDMRSTFRGTETYMDDYNAVVRYSTQPLATLSTLDIAPELNPCRTTPLLRAPGAYPGYRNSCTVKRGSFGFEEQTGNLYYVTGSDDFRAYGWRIPPADELLAKRERMDTGSWLQSGEPGCIWFSDRDMVKPVEISTPNFTLEGSRSIVNSALCHPTLPLIATAGIERLVRLHYAVPASLPHTQTDWDAVRPKTRERARMMNTAAVARALRCTWRNRSLRDSEDETDADLQDHDTQPRNTQQESRGGLTPVEMTDEEAIALFDELLRKEESRTLFSQGEFDGTTDESSSSDDQDDRSDNGQDNDNNTISDDDDDEDEIDTDDDDIYEVVHFLDDDTDNDTDQDPAADTTSYSVRNNSTGDEDNALVAARMIASRTMPRVAVQPARASLRALARGYHQDVAIKHKTGQAVVSSGPYGLGRNSTNGSVATVFGATGFLGRYVVSKLARQGTQVVVPYRDEEEKRHLRVLGDLGQIVPLEWDIRNEKQIDECLRHSDTVINLTGRNYETKNFSFQDVHVDGARRIAEAAQAAGVARFIHVSHLSANPDSPSGFLRTKALGEDAVRRAFAGATIVRPASIYGHEDRFLNKIASWPITWKLNNGQTRLRPVHSLDVAAALVAIAENDAISTGQTFSLAGPKTYTVRELMELVEQFTYQKLVSPDINIPRPVMNLAARAGECLWWPMFNRDEVKRRFIDELPDAPGTKTFADLGITPDVLEDVAIMYLRRFRSHLWYQQALSDKYPGAVKLRKERFRVIE